MPRQPSFAQVYDDLLTRYGREVADAFLEGVNDLTTRAQVERVVVALTAGDIDGAIAALNLDPVAFNRMIDAIEASYAAGGAATADSLPKRDPDGVALLLRFDDRNPRAEAWLRDKSSTLVTRIMDEQRQGIRQALTDGMVRGDNPRRVALDVVGRIDRATGRRTGGVIGLTPQQERFSRSAADELASGDPAQLRHYLTRELRDRRFDRTIAKAIREETPVPAETASRALVQYKNRLLRYRGELIGKVEVFTALAEARDEAYQQLVDKGRVSPADIVKTWRHFASENPRVQHIAMQGKKARLNQPFVLPDGTTMRFPHDERAPIKHRAGCKCQADYRIDWSANVR